MFINPHLKKMLSVHFEMIVNNTASLRVDSDTDYEIQHLTLKNMNVFINANWIMGIMIVTIPFVFLFQITRIIVKYKYEQIRLNFIEALYVYFRLKIMLKKHRANNKAKAFMEFRKDYKSVYDKDFDNKAVDLINK